MTQHTGEVSVLTDFDLAAQACGHDTTTNTGAADARRDPDVWDVLDAWQVEQHIANARAAIANSKAVSL